MGFFTTGPTTADELDAQNNQPLAQPNIGADEMSSTTSLQGNDLARQLSQAVGGTTDTSGGFQGYSNNNFGGNTGGSTQTYSPYSTSFSGSPDLSGASSFNYSSGGNSVNNPFSGGGSSDFSYGSGGNLGYNTSFLDNFGGPNTGASSDYWAGNRAFNFGDQKLGQAAGVPSWVNDAAGLYGAATGNYDVSRALGLSGNNAWDTAAQLSGNQYLGLLNDDWSQRGMVGKAVGLSGTPYGGALMAGMDYGQGVTNWGSIGGAAGGLLGGPLGAWVGSAAGNYFGGKDYNENWVGPSDTWAEANGYKQGTEMYDQAVDNFRSREARGLLTENQQQYKQDWMDQQVIDQTLAEFAAREPATSIEDAISKGKDFGQPGDTSYVRDGVQFNNENYNWNNDTSSGTDTSGGWGDTDTSEGTTAGDYSEAGFSKEDADFAQSFDEPSDSGGGDSGGGGGGSYIATAATNALGEEGLTIFEEWRDYMFTKLPTFTTSYGRYRVTAPKIVRAIDSKDNSKALYKEIWDEYLKPIFNLIKEDKDSEKALKDYKIMVKELQIRFLKEKE